MLAISNHVKVGFMEGLASNLAKLKVTPIDGYSNKFKVSFNDDFESEDINKVVESYLGLLLNCGVIGALVITLLFSVAITSQSISDESIEYFTEDGCNTMFNIFFILVTAGFYMSCLTVISSIFKYKQLSFWMANIELKSIYVEKLSLTALIILATGMLPGSIMIAVPFGSAIFISPVAGLSSLIILLLTAIYNFVVNVREEAIACILVHQNLRKKLKLPEENIK